MRTTILATLATLVALTATPVDAQMLTPGVHRAEVRVTARLAMPPVQLVLDKTAPIATGRAQGYTEYTMTYRIAANTEWQLTATQLPQGVTLQNEAGEWQQELGTVANRGQATNPTDVTVKVRVATTAARTWAQDLRLEMGGTR